MHKPPHFNHPAATFCIVCRKPTTISNTQYFIKIKTNLNILNGGDLPMIYNCDTKFDPISYRVEECPRCHNEVFSSDATYCRICGLSLTNMCVPPESLVDQYGNFYSPEIHSNPPDARFCEYCGFKTTYYENEVLKNYETVQEELAKEKEVILDDIPF